MGKLGSREIQLWKAEATQDLEYHRGQFLQPYRSTVHLSRFMHSLLKAPGGEALDVGCGAGANIYHLSREFPDYRWSGVDIAGEVLFEIGRERFAERLMSVQMVEGDFYSLTEAFPAKQFDLVVSIQTFLVVDRYEAAIDQLLAMTKGWLFITGLFTDFDVDASIAVTDFTWPPGLQGPHRYNVYSLSRLRDQCQRRGALEFHSQDFDIDIDLPKPAAGGMGSYTERLADGRRLQFSGPVLQPWKFVAVRMGGKP